MGVTRLRSKESDWISSSDMLCGTNGKPDPIVANVLTALRENPGLRDAFAYDEMLRAPVLMHRIGQLLAGREERRPVTDEDLTELQSYLQRGGIRRIGIGPVYQAVHLLARENAFHSIRDWLGEIGWDGIKRLSLLFPRYFGSEMTEYTKAIGRMFLISMVARVFEPGCKSDHVVVLEGEQGSGKSTACQILAGECFSDNLPEITTKDASQHLRGKWLVEIAEMHAFSRKRAEAAKLKGFITRTEERYRPSHGRLEVHEPRQCIFIGTTNERVYLHDNTGGRRFWPVGTGTIHLDDLRRCREQLFAEAVRAYHDGEPWHPTKAFEKEHMRPQQDARLEVDAWEEAVAQFIAGYDKVTVSQVAQGALAFETQKVSRDVQNRIIDVLTNLKWVSGKRSAGKRWYVPAGAAVDV